MKIFEGKVEEGRKDAGPNLRDCVGSISDRIGIPNIITGTLNVRIAEPYFVPADATILPPEYLEKLKLKRCRIRGVRCCIMRPDLHETVPESETARRLDALTRVEIMSDRNLRDALNLNNGDTVEVEIDGDENHNISNQ